MSRPRFSEMLVNRRRQLGLSLTQASNVLRLKEQVLLAFEEGDFQSLPKSGYAQGMLSSYARYLGLNPHDVIEQFSEDLFEYNAGNTHGGGRSRRLMRTSTNEPQYELPNTGASAVRRASSRYQPSSNLSPDSSGSSDPVGFRTVTSRPGRGSQGAGWQGADEPTGRMPRSRAAAPYSTDPTRQAPRQGYPQGRPYTGRAAAAPSPEGYEDSSSDSFEARRAARQSRRATRDGSTSGSGQRGASARRGDAPRRPYEQGDITTRQVRPSEYVDDLRYDDSARPYEAASTQAGRRSSRSIASPQRPNVKRRQPNSYQRQLSSRGSGPTKPPKSGIVGVIQAYFSDPTRATVTVLVGLALILIVILAVSVQSCTSTRTTTGKQVSVATTTSATTSASTTSDTQKAAESAALSEAAARAATTAAITETDVEVSVASGEVTWVEITNDGQSEVAETVTGPWSGSYVVTDSITIQVADPTAVSVTKNGTAMQFDSKTSGLGKLTIAGTQVASTTEDAATTSDTASATTSSTTS